MGVKFTDSVERMKKAINISNDSELARALEITPQALSNFKKRGEIPSDLVIQFAVKYKLSVDSLIADVMPDIILRKGVETIYIETKPPVVAEPSAIYNVREDAELAEIVDILQHDLPEAKKLVLKILKGRKEFKEGMEGLSVLDRKKIETGGER